MLTGSDSRAVVDWQTTCISGMFAGEKERVCMCAFKTTAGPGKTPGWRWQNTPPPKATYAHQLCVMCVMCVCVFCVSCVSCVLPAGAMSSFISSPTELLKIRMQLQKPLPGAPGYMGPLHMLRHVVQHEGVLGA